MTSFVEYTTIGISALALLVSCSALYVVNFWKGQLKCSKPVQFFFGYAAQDKTKANVSIQCFIHSTGIVGQVIDHMFLEVKQGETKQRFTSWSAGTHSSNRIRLAGFKIPRDGHSIDFIFFTPMASRDFRFNQSNITVSLHARLSGSKKHKTLFEEEFELDQNLWQSIESLNLAVFELNSTGEGYHSYTDKYVREISETSDNLIENKK